jgi:hypothetical protein
MIGNLKESPFMTFLLLFTAFTCLETGTAFGISDSTNSSALQVNLTNQNPDTTLPDKNVTLGLSLPNSEPSMSEELVTPLPSAPMGSNDLKDTTSVRSVSSGLIDSSYLQVNLTNQNPDAARPGETLELTVSVQNIGHNNLKDIIVTVKPEYPFSQVSGESLIKSISYLNARQEKNDGAVLKFKLMTDANASRGTCDISITTTAKESGSSSNIITITKTFQLEVRGKEYAQIVTINKANIDVGKEETLEFIITNTGDSPLKNMVVSWKDPKGVILPVYSDNTKYIKYLETNQSAVVNYSVMADVNANPGLYTLEVKLNFENYESKNESILTAAGLFVGGTTDFDVSFSESDQGQISLSVANVGNNKAYAVKVLIPEQKDYKVIGSPSTIVGNLEKGDYTIASFNVTSIQTSDKSVGITPRATITSDAARGNASSDSANNHSLKVQIEYTDAKGERIRVNKDVAIPVSVGTRSFSMARNNESSFLNSSFPYLVLIVIAGAGVLLYRKLSRKVKKAK